MRDEPADGLNPCFRGLSHESRNARTRRILHPVLILVFVDFLMNHIASIEGRLATLS